VWKQLRLITLGVFTLILLYTSAPAWVSAVLPRQDTPWDSSDAIELFVPNVERWNGVFRMETRFESAGQPPAARRGVSTELAVAPSAPSEPLYLAVTGKAAVLVESCSGTKLDASGYSDAVGSDAAARITRDHGFLLRITDTTYCPLRSELLWTKKDAVFTFTTPLLVVRGQQAERSGAAAVRTTAGSPCIQFMLNRGLGTTLEYESKEGADTTSGTVDLNRPPARLLDAASDQRYWVSCRDQGMQYVSESLILRVTDLELVPGVSRNQFLAGIILGIIGGVMLELVTGVLDAQEEFSSVRRMRRRDKGIVKVAEKVTDKRTPAEASGQLKLW
jgi:hypothetical protein